MSDERKKVLLRGQPQRGAVRQARVPIRFEKLLVRAAADPEFRTALLADREAALACAGVELSETEKGMLRASSDARLAAMIDGIDLKRHTRRPFGKAVATAVFAAAAASTTLAGGCEAQSAGSRPDVGYPPSDTVEIDQSQPSTDGITADVITVDVYDPGPDEGIRPDIYDGAARGVMADVPEDDAE